MKLRPVGEGSGTVLPETAREKPPSARVVAIGDTLGDGKVSEGDPVVHVARYSGTEIRPGDVDYRILDADDLLGIVEEKKRMTRVRESR